MKSMFMLVVFSIFAFGCSKDAPQQSEESKQESSNASTNNDEALKKVFGNLDGSRLK